MLIQRPRVDEALARALEFPLTVVRADAGYGKTTAVASWLARSGHPHVWYNVGDGEADPGSFLRHVVQAFRATYPTVGERSLERLSSNERSPRTWALTIDALSNDLLDALSQETVLVLDDFDRVNVAEVNAVIERFVETMPPRLHLVITARTMPSLRSRARLRASGELLEIKRADLAFTATEVSSLFAHRLKRDLSPDEARAVAVETEGWPIALQMLSDSVGGTHAQALDNMLQRIPGPSELLFDYLAEEVFLRQNEETRRFLGESAILRRLDPEACDATLGLSNSVEILRFLEQSSLFVTSDGAFRYHHLFADFLQRRAGVPAQRRAELHRRAAEHFQHRGDEEEAVHHLLEAGAPTDAAVILERIAARMVESGRHQALSLWLERLPVDVIAGSAELLLAQGDSTRLLSRLADALPAYRLARDRFRASSDLAGEVRALRGEALLYLDTVQPSRAEPLLREALRLVRGERQARLALFLLLAENRLNAGSLRQAERMYRVANRLMGRGDVVPNEPRLLARTGKLADARRVVEESLRTELTAPARPRAPRSHREATALLAWIDMLMGDSVGARQHAAESLDVAHSLNSPMIEGIALSRLGLAWLTGHDYDVDRARDHLLDALRVAERIGSPRFQVESLFGQVILAGLAGNPEEANRLGQRALGILADAGDRYLHGIVTLTIGAALATADHAAAEGWLNDARSQADANADPVLQTLAASWLAVHHHRAGHASQSREWFARALSLARTHGYEFVFDGTSLLAPKDLTVLRALLRRAHENSDVGDYARGISRQLDPSDGQPGSTGIESVATAPLYIQTLGPFRVWRRGQEIPRSAWGREKAVHLLQLLVVHRERGLHREQVIDALWSEGSGGTAATGLRVALSALRNALEPERATGGDGQFVRRDTDTLRLATEAGVQVDVDEFSRLLKSARTLEVNDADLAIARYESALALYKGDFLSDNRYAEWADQERQRRRAEYLAAAERLSGLLLRHGDADRAARWAETMLQHDPLWEAAYALLMEAYWKQGNRALAIRAFNRCRRRLRDSLGVEPSAKTLALLEQISRPERAGRKSGTGD